ncbi:MAG TPA: phosphatidylglycerol lysyltransferase domain-containing protein [Candidatus Saccharimonadales bacterium]|nr:phosphatidylglycerol lysyltransferase domain-containing protein [Candidatus Saccharimonadales bacterium]
MKNLRSSIVGLIAVLVLFAGVLNITSTFSPLSLIRTNLFDVVIPLEILNFSSSATIIAGFFLIFLSKGIFDRKKRAWFFSLVILVFSSILHLVKGFDFGEAIISVVVSLALFMSRGEFYVESSTAKIIEGVKTTVVILLFLLIYSLLGFFILKNQFNLKPTLPIIVKEYEYSILGVGADQLVPRTHKAQWFEGSISTVGVGILILFFANFYLPDVFSKTRTQQQTKYARDLILKYSRNPVSYIGLMNDKQLYFSPGGNAFIPFKIASTVAVVLGDPVGSSDLEIKQLVESFVSDMHKNGLTPVFLAVTLKCKQLFENSNLNYRFKSLKIGEDAVVKTDNFSLEGREIEDVRHGVTRAKREGIYYKWYSLNSIPQAVNIRFRILREQWLFSRKTSALTFSSDYFPLPHDPEAYLLAAYDANHNLAAAFTFYPYKQKKGYALDLMLKSGKIMNGLMEAAIAESIFYFKNKGVDEISLGLAPLADVEPEEVKRFTNKTTSFIFNNLNQFYNYRSLFKFKAKFKPSWEPRYLLYESDAKLLSITLAIVKVHLKKGLVETILRR